MPAAVDVGIRDISHESGHFLPGSGARLGQDVPEMSQDKGRVTGPRISKAAAFELGPRRHPEAEAAGGIAAIIAISVQRLNSSCRPGFSVAGCSRTTSAAPFTISDIFDRDTAGAIPFRDVCHLHSVNNLCRMLQVAVPAVVVAMVTFRSLSSTEIGTPATTRCKVATHRSSPCCPFSL